MIMVPDVCERAWRSYQSGGARSLLGKAAARAARTIWRQEKYIVYALPAEVLPRTAAEKTVDIAFVGVNRLCWEGEERCSLKLPAQYQGFASSGQDGVVALRGNYPVGWVWVKRGPYVEPTGCGRIALGPGLQVIQFFEVAPEVRGQGVGQELLRELTQRLLSLPREPTIAFVGEHNTFSRRSFERLNYSQNGQVVVRAFWGKGLISAAPAVLSY